ncbi:hypothetical protein BDV26DRAFT_276867 [Aspergillus bertholletiae]|uniref:F-box domain-containing protein n=1 Tax=Aspergillus bertholletiae TaxID=1226010 RepID=A0A5N7AME1_9EURO|nr:hypothetical protein BDV26DRAFT_276867 [Aspergillus bertholletiae]
MARSSTATLINLPAELQLQIVNHLDYPSQLILSQSNRYLRSIVEVEKPTTVEQKLSYLCVAETWRRYEDYFACSRCLKLRSKDEFADKQVSGKRGKQHVENNRRFCLTCGVWKGIYQTGQVIRIKKHDHFLCCLCWEICGYGLYCRVCSRCEDCLQRAMAKSNTESAVSEQLREDSRCPNCLEHRLRYLGDPEPTLSASAEDMLLHLPLALKMAEFKEYYGMIASPEWFEEDIAKGIF